MRAKLGLSTALDDDRALVEQLLDLMANNRVDFTLTFYQLSLLDRDESDDAAMLALFGHAEPLSPWLDQWRRRLNLEGSDDEARKAMMRKVNPVYIPRNHLIEAAIRAAEDRGDFSLFHELHEVLQQPYQVQQGRESYMQPPQPHEVVQQTFCGT